MADLTVTATVDEDLWNRAQAHAGGDADTLIAAGLTALIGATAPIASTYEVPSAAPETEEEQERQLQVGT